MAIEPIKGFYVHDEATDTDGVARYDYNSLENKLAENGSEVNIVGTYSGSYTNSIVDDVPGLTTVYAPCDGNADYVITKNQTSRFTVFFTAYPPVLNVPVLATVVDNAATTIKATSPSTAKYICIYLHNTYAGDSMPVDDVIETLAIVCRGTVDTYARKEINNLEKVTNLVDGNVSVLYERGGLKNDGTDGDDDSYNNRMRTGYITGNNISIINNDSNNVQFSVRYYRDGTFLSSDSGWRSASLSNVFGVVDGCNQIRVTLRLTTNANINYSNIDTILNGLEFVDVGIAEQVKNLKAKTEHLLTPKSYYSEEIETTAVSVTEKQTEPCVTFALVTDPHYLSVNGGAEGENLNPTVFEDCIANMKSVFEQCKVDFVFCNGDFTDGDVAKATTKDRVKTMMNGIRAIGKPFFCSIGNHDDNRYSTPLMTSDEIFSIYTAQGKTEVKYGSMNGTNYYFDYPNLKIRFIVINSNTFSGSYGYTEETRTFLTNTLSGMPEGYQGFLFVHTPPGSIMNYNNTVRPNGTDVETIITESGRMCAMFYGHCHQDNSFGPSNSGALNVYDYLAIGTCCEKCTNSNGDTTKWSPNATMPTRIVGTYTEDLWDIVVIRPSSRKINMIRFGAGNNREFTY